MRDYLRTEPNRLIFLVLFNSLSARSLGEAEHWFIQLFFFFFYQLKALLKTKCV